MSRHRLDEVIRGLLLVRLGQLLGADTDAARAVADLVDALLAAIRW